MKTYGQIHYEENRQDYIQRAKDWYQANKDKKKEYDKQRAINNKEKMSAYEKERRKLPHRRAAHAEETRKRRMTLKQASPLWLTKDDKLLMRDIYTLSSIYSEFSGIKYHVDHIIPLRGEGVCGFHIPSNLQILPAVENIKKNNRHYVERHTHEPFSHWPSVRVGQNPH